MGLDPISDDFILGVTCPTCSAVTFPDGTPLNMDIEFAGITQCPGRPAVPIGVGQLTQSTNPCKWTGTFGGWLIEVLYTATYSSILVSKFGTSAFSQLTSTLCSTSFSNGHLSCGGIVAGYGGTANLWWGPTIGA